MKMVTGPSLSRVVRTAARSVVRLMFLFGFYIVFHGPITHGDGFAGGVIMALGFVLLMVVFGKDEAFRILPRSATRILAASGALLLLAVGVLGLGREGHFFFNFLGKGSPFQYWSAGIIPLCNLAILLIVTGALFGAFAALMLFHLDAEKKP
ncbi:MAG: MnhB domain-containing protein [Elusimicrobiota bacterium]|jgi:multicomponent Na+:H+ antiporter subunit B